MMALFRNKTDMLQVVYDEGGNKYEVVPGGTVELDEKHAARYGCLELVKDNNEPKKATQK